MADGKQGVASAIAQSVAESLLGRNAAGFTRAMKGRYATPATPVESINDRLEKANAKVAGSPTSRDIKKGNLGASAGANDIRPPKREITGATGSQQSQAAKTGGRVVKSGRVKLHRGEVVRKHSRSRSRGR